MEFHFRVLTLNYNLKKIILKKKNAHTINHWLDCPLILQAMLPSKGPIKILKYFPKPLLNIRIAMKEDWGYLKKYFAQFLYYLMNSNFFSFTFLGQKSDFNVELNFLI